MLKECLEVFKTNLDTYEKEILDSYVPADGTYVIVSKQEDKFEIKDSFDIKLDKKTKEIDRSNMYFKDVCIYDYNSKLIDMNKPIDGKKIIHSNNYLSFFIKKENLNNGKLTNEIIDKYYDVLSNPSKKYDKGPGKIIYESVENKLGKVDTETVEKIKLWIKDNIFTLPFDVNGKDYLKIFFEYPMDLYKKEGERYLIPNIYNSNDYNLAIKEKIYGVPNNNMGLNSKKPYLENKTRKCTVPYLLDNEEVQLQKKFFDYLMNLVSIGKVNLYVDTNNNKIFALENGKLPEKDFSGLFLRLRKAKEVEIHDFDTITGYKNKLVKNINFSNILKVDLTQEKTATAPYGLIETKADLQKVLNEVFFSTWLTNNYFTDAGDIKLNDSILKMNLLISRDTLFNWIYKGIDNGVSSTIDRISLNLIKDSIGNGFIQKACHQFNLRESLLYYFMGGKNMADIIQDLKSSLRVKVNDSVTNKIDTDAEYYFAVGQLVSYLISKSKGKKKPHSLANPFVNGKNNADIKEKLRKLYNKYSYDPDINGRRFNNLYAMIVGYVPEGKVNQDLIIAGYLNNNLIYESNKEEKVNE